MSLSRCLAALLPLLVVGHSVGGQAIALKVSPVIMAGQAPHAAVSCTGAAGPWKVAYALRVDPGLTDSAPPDPVHGADLALGCRSWTEAKGQVIERGSLTDGKDYTEATTPWQEWTEASQVVDLGRAVRITRITYLAGDANHAWKLDVSASLDNRGYTPVPGLQGFDQYKRWGEVELPVAAPFTARYLRLRHHHGGAAEPVLRMARRLSVFDGVTGKQADAPITGPLVASGSLAAASGREVALKLPATLQPGCYLLGVVGSHGPDRRATWSHILVRPKPLATVGPGSRFGINAADPKYAGLLRELGVGWVRFENLKWPFYSPDPGVYRFDGSVKPWQVQLDDLLKAYTSRGMSVLPFLFMTAPYASSAPAGVAAGREPFYPPREPALFAEFAREVALRYGPSDGPRLAVKPADGYAGLGCLSHYEIWNEPNLTDAGWGPWVGSARQYMDLLRASSEAIKRVDPRARISNGGWAGIQVKTVDQLRTLAYADGKRPLDFIDLLNVHFYSGRVPPEIATDDFNAGTVGDQTAEADFRRLAAWRDRWKRDMPIWLTETGYDSAGPYGTDERTQAARLPRVVMLALANGMDKVFVYRESGSTPSMHAAAGMMRDDGTIKPSFLTYATLIRQMQGVTGGAVRLPDPDANVRLYLWHRGKVPLLVAYCVEGTGRLNLDLGLCQATDAFGYTTRIGSTGGMSIGEFPTYIEAWSNDRPIQARLKEMRAAAAAQAATARRLAALPAYLFKFGRPVEGVTLDVGVARPYVAVVPDALWRDGAAFGFVDSPAGAVQDRTWIQADLDRTAVAVFPGTRFRMAVAPGQYHLRLGVSPYDGCRVTVAGMAGGDRALPAAKGEVVVETDLRSDGRPITVTVDGYAALRWLTVVPR